MALYYLYNVQNFGIFLERHYVNRMKNIKIAS